MGRYLIIFLAGCALFLPFLGNVHLFDWDEINFAECAREMIVSGNYMRVQINYEPFWEKPPLFIWLQVLSMKMFGINEYAARFPNAVIGIVTLLTLFYAGKRVWNERLATWWVILYASCWLPHFYFKSGIIDPLFNLLIFLAFFQVYLLKDGRRKVIHVILSGIFLGLAVLTKGPVAILVAGLAFLVYLVINRGLKGYQVKHLAAIGLFAFLTTSVWFGIEVINNGWGLVNDFILYQVRLLRTEDAGHGGPFFYHFIVLLVGCFPASVFLFQYNRKLQADSDAPGGFTRWMWIMFWVVLLLFSIVKTKIVHYSSLCYFPLTYLAALQLYSLSSGKVALKRSIRVLLLIVGSLLAILITALPLVGIYKDMLIPYIDDAFAVGNFQADVHWHYSEALWGIFYLAGLWVSVYIIRRNFYKGMIGFCVLQVIILQVTVIHFTPKIEAFSQRAAIEYFKSFAGKDVYVQVLGYKSYAHLFYTQKMPPATPAEQELLYGPIDKPAYFICKVTEAERFRALPQLQQTGEKNGFVFFKRVN